ncbi:MAG: helix-hairpin-helix domain-containing protein [Actinobacteria bacterium]|nr:helix-hairpin-helix domain-containing protein [Actinomycetota bacterium]
MAGFGDWRDRVPIAAVIAVLVVVVLGVGAVTVLLGGRAGSWSGGAGGADVALSLPKADGSVANDSSGPNGSAADATTSTTSGGLLHVHAAGAVTQPGVVEVPAGSRVTDVVAAAGGPATDADLNQVNLAALVADGERVYIPRQGEVGAGMVAAGGGSSAASEQNVIVNLNEADASQLETLPGVGPATAKAIVDYRAEHGRFRSVDDLLNVRGIGPSKLEQIKPHARV